MAERLCPGPLACTTLPACTTSPSADKESHLTSWVSLASEGGALFLALGGRAIFSLHIYLLRFLSPSNFGVGGVAGGLCLVSSPGPEQTKTMGPIP